MIVMCRCSSTTAICGVHPRGKPPDVAVAEMTVVTRALVERRTGVPGSAAATTVRPRER